MEKAKTSKKLLCLLLSLAMLITMIPGMAFAEGGEVTAPVLEIDVEDITYDLPAEQSKMFFVQCKQDEGTITYQWFSNDIKSYDDAVPVEGATRNSYMPNATTIEGTTYYFVEITKTTDAGSSSIKSSIAARTIISGENKGYGDIRGEESIGSVDITIKDTVPYREDLVDGMMQPIEDPGPMGTILSGSFPIYPSDSMMTAVARACKIKGISIEGAEKGYITSIDGRAEFDRGKDSGWMGTLNNWFTNEGFQNYTVENGKLNAGDVISIEYTTDLGEDIGGGFNNAELSLSRLSAIKYDMESGTGITGEIIKNFSKESHEYFVNLESGYGIRIEFEASNKRFKTVAIADGVEYNSGSRIPVNGNTNIEVVVQNVESEEQEIYTIHAVKEQKALNAGEVSAELYYQTGEKHEPGAVTERIDEKTNLRVYSMTLPDYSQEKEKNVSDISFNISDEAVNRLPEGTKLSLVSENGEKWYFDQNGELLLKGTFIKPGKYTYLIKVEYLTGVVETYSFTINKSSTLPALEKLQFIGVPEFEGDINDQPEGTIFQLDENGEETGDTGFDRTVFNYNVYIREETKLKIGMLACATHSGSIKIDGETIQSNTVVLTPAFLQLRNKGFSVPQSDSFLFTIEAIHKTSKEKYVYNINFIRKVLTPEEQIADIIAGIDELPEKEYVSYSEDGSMIVALQKKLALLSEEQKEQIPAEKREKLQELADEVSAQKTEGEQIIQSLVDVIAQFKDTVTSDLTVTQEYYEKYGDAIKKAEAIRNGLSGWIKEAFEQEYKQDNATLNTAYDLINKYEIAGSDESTINKPTDYVDYFMISGNAYNLTLGKEDTAYPVSFRDVINSAKRDGEACLPWNTPGRIEYTIADENIVEMKEVLSSYTDMGLGGGNQGHENLLYYLIPKNPGTTTMKVTLTDETGKYYGQIPEIIIHVNNEEETSINDLENKLTNINLIEKTRKYDTWYYFKGTEGAPFTFKVNGKNAVVNVLTYPIDGTKQNYTVNSDGTVTVLLKDGYNPIEVTAELNGKTVTQVYGLKGKIIDYSISNESRPGKELRQGDTVRIHFTGIEVPVHKILRIYNPVGPAIQYSTNLPGLGQVVGEGTQYTIGDLKFLLTGSGTVKLTNGEITEKWFGSPLYSESTQGNTGGTAPVGEALFSVIPDIEFEVQANEAFSLDTKLFPEIKGGNRVKAGDTVTIELNDLKVSEAMNVTDNGNPVSINTAATTFYTSIPGCSVIKSELYTSDKPNSGVLKKVTFKIPRNTPAGTYRISGGNIDIDYTKNWFPAHIDRYAMQIADLEIEVTAAESFDEIYKTTGDYLAEILKGNETFGTEWPVIGLARADRTADMDAAEYYADVEKTVEENGSSKLHASKSTENSRTILALTAIGKDVTDVAGYNLLEPLADLNYLKKQGINGPIWALIALDSHNYEIPEVSEEGVQATRENIIETILAAELEDGGWALSGETADPDMTAMAIQALAPYYSSNAQVEVAVDKALDCLSALQNADGGYTSWGTTNSESCAQVVVALTALGINPADDLRFVKNGNSVMDALLGFYVEGGGFSHTLDGEVNGMATEQGYYALASYARMQAGKTSLYDMSDVTIGKAEEGNPPGTQGGETESGKTPATGDESMPSGWSLLALAAGAGILMTRKKKNAA